MATHESFARLVAIMDRLRGPNGCPWDRKQSFESLKPYIVEETYELLEAIDAGQPSAMCEELGDILLQIVFHAQLAKEQGSFDIDAVCQTIGDKLVRRHPHIFGDAKADTAEQVLERWEQIKQRQEGKGVLSGVPAALPALLRAQRVTEKAARVGFDWNQVQPVLDKLQEEIAELQQAAVLGDPAAVQHELGDVLFSVVNLARHLKVDAEQALRTTVDRFIRRFLAVEQRLQQQGKRPQDCTLAELDQIWEAVKADEPS